MTTVSPAANGHSHAKPGTHGRRIAVGPLPSISLPPLPPLPSVAALCAWRPPPPSDLLPTIEALLRRDEADVVLLIGNVALVAFEVIDWPVAALTLAVHFLARSRFKALEAVAEVAEEAD